MPIYEIYDINGNPLKLKIMEPDDVFKNIKTIMKFHIATKAINDYGKDVDLVGSGCWPLK